MRSLRSIEHFNRDLEKKLTRDARINEKIWFNDIVHDPKDAIHNLKTCLQSKTKTWNGHSRGINDFCISKDRDFVVTASTDKTVRVWSMRSRKERMKFSASSSSFLCLALSPDNRYVAAGGQDRSIRIYDLKKNKEVKVLRKNNNPVKTLTFTQDGKFLLTGFKGKIRVFDMKTKSIMMESKGHSGTLHKIILSNNRKNFLTCGKDRKVLIWDN